MTLGKYQRDKLARNNPCPPFSSRPEPPVKWNTIIDVDEYRHIRSVRQPPPVYTGVHFSTPECSAASGATWCSYTPYGRSVHLHRCTPFLPVQSWCRFLHQTAPNAQWLKPALKFIILAAVLMILIADVPEVSSAVGKGYCPSAVRDCKSPCSSEAQCGFREICCRNICGSKSCVVGQGGPG